jgi:hypothetical protein
MSIQGVTFQYGNIQVVANKASGNEVDVRINPLTGNVRVGVNGQFEEFPADQVFNVTYQGGAEGGDTFINALSVPMVCYGYAGYNNVVGGMAFNFVYLHGNNNIYSAAGVSNTIFLNGGQGSKVKNPTGSQVVVYP